MGIASLDAALAGLRISQQQINVISNNVANATTEGYTRKILPQNSAAIAGVTVGVRSETIIRRVDLNLERDLWTQVSAQGTLDVQATYLNRLQQFHGAPEAQLSFAAEIGRLRDSFSALADSPEDGFLQATTVNRAIDTARKFNDLGDLINTMRNDTQSEIKQTVDRINALLDQIADTNNQIQDNIRVNRSSAQLEDQRDNAIKELSDLIEISFFIRGDGVMVVQTNRGAELATNRTTPLTFTATPVSASSYYPENVNGVFVGNPVTDTFAVDLTTLSPGGRLGGLLKLRDETLPKQMAQVDEAAHKLALRMDAQGLRLFTDPTGNIPSDAAPDPTTDPPTPVAYVGFSQVMEVNQSIINNNSLLKDGTYGATLDSGSNEVLSRVAEFAFGSINYQQAENTNTATQVDLLNTGGADLQTWLGLFSSNTLNGGRNLQQFASIADLVLSANGDLDDPADQFQITFEEARTGLGPTTITVDLSVADTFPGATAIDQLVNHINNEITLAGVPAGLAAVASAGSNGQLLINTRGSYEIDSNFGATGMTEDGLVFLGLSDNAGSPIAPRDPYFDIQVGNNNPTRIVLEPGDTSTELLTKLGAVPGLAIDTTNFALDGILRLRPGNDFDNPDFGGAIKLSGGPFQTAGAGYGAPPATTTRTALDDAVNIVSALFGTYSVSGTIVSNSSPVNNIVYGSETNASLTPPIPTIAFRQDFLGPNAAISTDVIGSNSILDFAQKIVNQHSQDAILISNRLEDETSLRDLLESDFLDESGVNIDEELGNLIVFQTAYSASARVLTAIDELFQELLNAI